MILSKNIFVKFIAGGFVICLLLPCDVSATRDNSVDCAGRPRWDRFVVDEGATKWDPTTAECFGGNTGDVSIYGSPAMYGEFEENPSHANNKQKMYGTLDAVDSRALYGKYDAGADKPRPKAIPAKLPIAKSSVQKYPVNIKPAVKKSSYNAKSAAPIKVAPPEPIETPAPIIAQPEPPSPQPAPSVVMPDRNARNIANTLNDKFDIDSYCRQINPPVLGPMPSGLVLMPGRPDLMSCVTK